MQHTIRTHTQAYIHIRYYTFLTLFIIIVRICIGIEVPRARTTRSGWRQRRDCPTDRWRAPVARALPAFTRWRLLDTPAAAPRAGAKFYNILPSAVCLYFCVCVCVIHFLGYDVDTSLSLSFSLVYLCVHHTSSDQLLQALSADAEDVCPHTIIYYYNNID